MRKTGRIHGAVFLLSMILQVADAAVVVDLVGGTGNDVAETTFSYSSMNTTADFDSGVMGTSALMISDSLSSAGDGGSLEVTWRATAATAAADWNFDLVTAYEIRDFNTGWGVSTLNDATAGSGNFHQDEAFLLTFNTSNLTLGVDQQLVFSVSTRDSGDGLQIYQRTGTGSSSLVLDENTTAETFSTPVEVGGLNEFAIVQSSGANLLSAFSIDIVSSVADTNAPTPNPATWASPPAAYGPFAITMTATTGSDPSGVQYYFKSAAENPAGADDSGWQNSPVYTDSGLMPTNTYSYYVRMRDGAGNEGDWSSIGTATTSADELSGHTNVMIIIVDDMGAFVPGVFGGDRYATNLTPRIDQLAAEGMRFENAHVTVAVCQPSRQVIMTGKYPIHHGGLGFTPIDDDVVTLGQILKDAGYYNATYNKVGHLEPTESYAWDYTITGASASYGRSTVRMRQLTEEILQNARDADKPFFLFACTTDPHGPFYRSDREFNTYGANAYDPLDEGGLGLSYVSREYTEDEVTLPVFLRGSGELTEFTQYINSCRRADDIVGEILDIIDEQGLRDNTIVMFLSDNGMPFSSAKHNTYFQSTKTPLIIRWPGTIQTNTVNTTDYVSGIDIMPTILEALDLATPTDLDGSSLLPILKGLESNVPSRQKVVTMHHESVSYINVNTQETGYNNRINDGYVIYSSGRLTRPKNMRLLQSNGYGYMFNAGDTGFNGTDPAYPMTHEATEGLNDQDWWTHRTTFLKNRGFEELYDLTVDQYCLNNLIHDPAYTNTIATFRADLLDWMNRVGDLQQIEYEHLISGDETPLATFVDFRNTRDGQKIYHGDELLKKIKANY